MYSLIDWLIRIFTNFSFNDFSLAFFYFLTWQTLLLKIQTWYQSLPWQAWLKMLFLIALLSILSQIKIILFWGIHKSQCQSKATTKKVSSIQITSVQNNFFLLRATVELVSSTRKGSRFMNLEFIAWMKTDQLLLSWMMLSNQKNELLIFIDCATSKQLQESLTSMFLSHS